MKLGVTGSRNGMTAEQLRWFSTHVGFATEFHHGDCVGVDDQAARDMYFFSSATVISHPPLNPKYRAYAPSHVILDPREYLERDRDIVNATDLLIGFPDSNIERDRSGTWYTIRFARHQGRGLIVVGPDGTVIETSGRVTLI